jgi:hypothetical protein
VGYEDEENPKVMEAYERVGSLVCTIHPLIHSFSSFIAVLVLFFAFHCC